MKRRRLTNEDKGEILRLYNLGYKLTPIYKETGIKPSTISGFLGRIGLKTNPSVNENYFNKIDTHNKAYILGFIAADGCVTKSKSNKNLALSIRINKKDVGFIEFFKKELSSTHKIYRYTQKMYNSEMVAISITRKQIADDLIELGIVPRKSLILGNIINNVDKKYRKSVILGYFDGDGCIYIDNKRNKKTISIRGTHELLSGILNELGLDLNIRQYDSTPSLTIGSKSGINIFKTIYGNTNFCLERKREKIFK